MPRHQKSFVSNWSEKMTEKWDTLIYIYIYIYIYYIDVASNQSSFFRNLPPCRHRLGTDQWRTEFPEMSVTVNQSETEFDDVIISDWPSVIIWLLIGAGRWQIDLALMQVLYNIYIYIYSIFLWPLAWSRAVTNRIFIRKDLFSFKRGQRVLSYHLI